MPASSPPQPNLSSEPAPRAESPRLAPAALLRGLADRIAHDDGSRSVVLVIVLNRSDRLLALAQDPSDTTVLREIAARVGALLRPADRYAFASREELWLLLAGLPSEALAELAGHALLEALRRPIETGPHEAGRSVQLQPSIGGAWAAAGSPTDPMVLLAAASEAASRARDHAPYVEIVQVHESREPALRRDDVERDLRRALESNELELHFQPQVDLRSGRCEDCEALIRWHRADGRLVNPATIASVCEERGLVGPLTHFALNTALRHLAGWRSGGLEMSVAINLSAITLSDPSFPVTVARALEIWGQPANRLTLELTESALVSNERTAIGITNELREIGCRLSIDDFGTGYSSFGYLRRFPLDELKIDQSFVRRALHESGERRIVQALVDLSHAFGLRAVAEGVENEDTLGLLRELGCDLAQGWQLSPALSAERLPEWCINRNRAAALTPATPAAFA